MNKLAIAALVLTTSGGCFNGCQKKKESEAIEPPPAMPAQPETPTKPMTGDEIAQREIACWGFYSDAKWDEFKACFAPDATYVDLSAQALGQSGITKGAAAILDASKASKVGVPDAKGDVRLVLVHGHDVAALTWISGTHTGPIEGVSGMNQKVGQLGGELVTFDDQGRVTQETDYDDDPTTTNQLVPDPHHPVRPADHMPDVAKEMVVAKNDDGEKANVAVVQSLIDAFDKHDAKAMGRAFADDLVWSEQENPKDWTKAQTLADAQANWKAFSDMKMTSTALWGAGSYVVLQASMEGTNDAAAPAMGIATATKKHVTLPFFEIDQIANGKIAKAWVVANSGIVPYELGLKPMPAMPATGSAGSAAPGSAGSAK